MQWERALEVIGLIGGIVTFFGFLLAPMFWIGSKIDHVRSDLEAFRAEVAKEGKDFHGRLCAIEEARKK